MKVKIAIAFLLLVISGCAKTIKPNLPPMENPGSLGERITMNKEEKKIEKIVEAPDWVLTQKHGVDEYYKTGAFFGVGSGNGENASNDDKAAADDRARNNLAGLFEFYQRNLIKKISSEELKIIHGQHAGSQKISTGIEEITATLLMKVEIVDHWEDPSSNQIYSLAKLDINEFHRRIKNHPQFLNSTQESIKINSDRLLMEMERDFELNQIMTQNGVGYEKQSGRFYLY